MKQIILASGSPRRRELLRQIGLRFKVVPSQFAEDMSLKMQPASLARFLSLAKAQAVAARYPHSLVIAADTFVVAGSRVIGKPKDLAEARRILEHLSGKRHSVITGFTIIDGASGRKVTRSIETKVFFRKLTGQEIDAYVKARKPLDLAGYAIQEVSGIFIERIEGDYFNIVGLPLCALSLELRKFGVRVLAKKRKSG